MGRGFAACEPFVGYGQSVQRLYMSLDLDKPHGRRGRRREACEVLLVDAANVIGSRPNGWWRDRAEAAAQLVEALHAATSASTLSPPVVVVLEGAARGATEEAAGSEVKIVHAPGQGDDTLVALAGAATEPVVLVSADRALGERCRAVGAQVVGPRWLLDRLGP